MTPDHTPRTLASRSNGARWYGPVTPEGKLRASRNALKHGLTSTTPSLLPDEDLNAFGIRPGRAAFR